MTTTELHAERSRLERQQAALLQISRRWRVSEHEFEQAAASIVEAAALAIGVERASIWLFSDNGDAINCIDLFEAGERRHTHGQALRLADLPGYFDAMHAAEVVTVKDVFADPRTLAVRESYLRPNGIGALLDAPIRHGKKVIGVLSHEHVGGPRAFGDDEHDCAMFFANLVSLAYEFHHPHTSERESAHRVSLLNAAFEAAGAGIIAIDNEGHATAYNQRVLDMFNMPESIMGPEGNNGPRAHHVAALAVDPDLVLEYWRAAHDDPEAERIDLWESKDGTYIECSSLPQRLDGQIIGRVWSFRDVTYQRRLEQELRELAVRDTLTGLHNRRWADQQLEQEIKRANRTKQPLAVAMLDIDYFKRVNDTHGHHIGDQVLGALADDFRRRLRVTDRPCRWGGEEFLVILPDTNRDGAVRVINDLRKVIARERRHLPQFTVSAGVAEYDGQTPEALVSAADARMYDAKQSGRNRVV